MKLKDALDQNKGVGPGFHFLRHALSLAIVLFHCRQVVYWTHSAELLTAAGVTDITANANDAAQSAGHFNLEDIVRPALHSLVGMFFALSGFLIAGSALRTNSLPKFFMNRALRIFPALSVETLLSALILGPIVTTLPLGLYFTNWEFYRYFGNIIGWVYFYLPGAFNANPYPRVVNGQLWTLPSEFYCYLTMLLFMATRIIKKRDLLLTFGTISMLAMLTLFYYDPTSYTPKDQNFFKPWYIVVMFWIGVIFFLYAEKIYLNFYVFLISALIYWISIFFNIATPLSGIFLTYCMVYIGFTKFTWLDKILQSDYSYGLFCIIFRYSKRTCIF